jgi:hypothetical protein
MQARYQIGDRVELTRDNGGLPSGYAWGRKGDRGVVVGIYDNTSAAVDFDVSRSETDHTIWAVLFEDLKPVAKSRPTLSSELSLKPFTKTVLLHLRQRGCITPL